jgi:hypothetical protein
MIRTEVLREVRKMRFLEVYEKCRGGRLSFGEAAETLWLSEHQFRRFRLGLGGGKALLDVLEGERQLVAIELLRASTEAMALQFADDGAQPIALARDAGDLFGMTRTLGEDQRAERLGITGEIVGVIERHDTGVTLPGFSPKRRARSTPM